MAKGYLREWQEHKLSSFSLSNHKTHKTLTQRVSESLGAKNVFKGRGEVGYL